MNKKGYFELKTNKFEYLYVTGHVEQFGDLKTFCGDDIRISYETAPGIGDYWLIQINDYIKEKWVTIPDNSYIINLYDEGFTYVDGIDASEYFNDISFIKK